MTRLRRSSLPTKAALALLRPTSADQARPIGSSAQATPNLYFSHDCAVDLPPRFSPPSTVSCLSSVKQNVPGCFFVGVVPNQAWTVNEDLGIVVVTERSQRETKTLCTVVGKLRKLDRLCSTVTGHAAMTLHEITMRNSTLSTPPSPPFSFC